jgi:hypothetical protein
VPQLVTKKVALSIIYIVVWAFILFIFMLPLTGGVVSLPFIPIGPEAFTGITLWQEIGIILFFVPCSFPLLIITVFYSIANSGD